MISLSATAKSEMKPVTTLTTEQKKENLNILLHIYPGYVDHDFAGCNGQVRNETCDYSSC
jgi:hypothetical protein